MSQTNTVSVTDGPHVPPPSLSAEYQAKLKDLAVAPLWEVMKTASPPNPTPVSVPHVWEYQKARPVLIEAGSLVSDKEAERRVLMLVNPTLTGPRTTETLYAGLQLVMPGETAWAHRHTAFALRFIIEGENGFTAVEGKKMYMEEGDVILTPSWDWHDHGHEGKGPLIWLDGLNLPLFQSIPINFGEDYHEPRFPSKVHEVSPSKFPWKPVQQYLDAQKGNYATKPYLHADGRPLSTTVGAKAERIAAGTSSPSHRDTCSYVYHSYGGSGSTTFELANGTTKTIRWGPKDTFAVPAWSRITHTADEGATAYLFSFSDLPLVDALGFYREE